MDPSVDGSKGLWIYGSMDPSVDGSKGRWIKGSMDPSVDRSNGRLTMVRVRLEIGFVMVGGSIDP